MCTANKKWLTFNHNTQSNKLIFNLFEHQRILIICITYFYSDIHYHILTNSETNNFSHRPHLKLLTNIVIILLIILQYYNSSLSIIMLSNFLFLLLTICLIVCSAQQHSKHATMFTSMSKSHFFHPLTLQSQAHYHYPSPFSSSHHHHKHHHNHHHQLQHNSELMNIGSKITATIIPKKDDSWNQSNIAHQFLSSSSSSKTTMFHSKNNHSKRQVLFGFDLICYCLII